MGRIYLGAQHTIWQRWTRLIDRQLNCESWVAYGVLKTGAGSVSVTAAPDRDQ
jgi:hypothetical protein